MADKDKSQRKDKGVAKGGTMKGSGTRQNQRTTKMENSDRLELKEEKAVTTGPLREKLQMKVKKANKLPAGQTLRARGRETSGRFKGADGTGLFLDDHSEDIALRALREENTYQLGPTKRFPDTAVTNLLMEVLSSSLKEERYDVHRARELTLSLSSVILQRVKAFRIPRYKIVVEVTVGQVKDQGTQAGSRCLWDPANDTFASYTFRNSSLFGQASVFAVYLE